MPAALRICADFVMQLPWRQTCNPCGVALGNTAAQAFQRVYEIIFGGIVALNRVIDEAADESPRYIWTSFIRISNSARKAENYEEHAHYGRS